jgi:LCP family protein required for cell wall assembly
MSTTIETQKPVLNLWQLWLKTTIFAGFFLIIFILITVLSAAFFGYRFTNQILAQAGMNYSQVFALLSATDESLNHVPNNLQILVLGTDELAERTNQPVLTDTILALNFDLNSGELNSLSIPRDLWHPDYLTKVNALYSYGDEYFPDQPEKFVAQAIDGLTGFSSDVNLVISLDLLAQLIQIVDGVEVSIEQGFTDEEFPRPGVSPTAQDPELLYKTVVFEPGRQTLDSERALEYIRSRKSADPEAGTDTARAARQQQVLDALLVKLTSKSTYYSSEVIGQLLKLYRAEIDQYWPLDQAMATGIKFLEKQQKIQFKQKYLPIYPDIESGLIFHPNPRLYQNQWVFAEKASGILKTEVPKILNLTQ